MRIDEQKQSVWVEFSDKDGFTSICLFLKKDEIKALHEALGFFVADKTPFDGLLSPKPPEPAIAIIEPAAPKAASDEDMPF